MHIAIFTVYGKQSKHMIKKITMEEAKLRFAEAEDFLIVDVRRPDEYSQGHIPDAINIPNEFITEEPKELRDKNQMLYVYCRSGHRSNEAAIKLDKLGYNHIVDCGGILDWTGEVEHNCDGRMPMIGDKAPKFKAITTNGKINFPSDYAGSWVVLFSHPADFTPVCTTEFVAFSRMESELEKHGVKLIGLSIDSLHAHLGWLNNIEKLELDGASTRINFPVIADISMNVAKKYGMLQTVANTQAIRAVFIIDPKGIIRCILYYPMCTGRNIAEILRIIESLQVHDLENVSTPANWQPGDKVIVGSPLTHEEMDKRLACDDTDFEVKEWYLTFKKL